jgi:hypothetical protein
LIASRCRTHLSDKREFRRAGSVRDLAWLPKGSRAHTAKQHTQTAKQKHKTNEATIPPEGFNRFGLVANLPKAPRGGHDKPNKELTGDRPRRVPLA